MTETSRRPFYTEYAWLILDVRDWSASAERKAREPLFRKRVSTDRGELTFTSVTTLDPDTRRLLIFERHELSREGDTRISEQEFVMRCWQREELDALFVRYGLGDVQYFGAYDPAIALGATDRIVAVAQKSGHIPSWPYFLAVAVIST